MTKYIFPTVMIILNLSQAVVMLAKKDLISAVYWLCAAILNLTVTIKQ